LDHKAVPEGLSKESSELWSGLMIEEVDCSPLLVRSGMLKELLFERRS